MTHKKQYIDYLKLLNYIRSHNIVVHCKTKDEAINFCKQIGVFGVVWFGTLKNINTNTCYEKYNNKGICYNIRRFYNSNSNKYKCSCGTVNYYVAGDYKILEWSYYMSSYQFYQKILKPKDLELGNVVVIGETGYIALSSDYKNDDLGFYWIEDNGNIHTDSVSFYKKNISNDLCIFDCNENHALLYGGATIDRIYKNINDFKENKNELYNKLIDENQNMFYCILNPKDNSDDIIISPNTKNYFDFSSDHTIKIQNNNDDKNNYITISPYQLTSFIAALNELKQMYESHGKNV